MSIHVNTKQDCSMEVFVDGVLAVYDVETMDTPKYSGLRFQERTVGYGRYYAAATENVAISRLVRLRKGPNISAYDVIVIEGQKYRIAQMQEMTKTMPHCIDLSLRQTERV